MPRVFGRHQPNHAGGHAHARRRSRPQSTTRPARRQKLPARRSWQSRPRWRIPARFAHGLLGGWPHPAPIAGWRAGTTRQNRTTTPTRHQDALKQIGPDRGQKAADHRVADHRQREHHQPDQVPRSTPPVLSAAQQLGDWSRLGRRLAGRRRENLRPGSANRSSARPISSRSRRL